MRDDFIKEVSLKEEAGFYQGDMVGRAFLVKRRNCGAQAGINSVVRLEQGIE